VRNAYIKFESENLKGKINYLEDLHVDGTIILKYHENMDWNHPAQNWVQ
jgi:hypothetical protein